MSKFLISGGLCALLLVGCVAKVSSNDPSKKDAATAESALTNEGSVTTEISEEVSGARTELSNVKEELAGIAASGAKVDDATLDKILERLSAAEKRLDEVLSRAEKLEKDGSHTDHDGHDHDHDHDHDH